MQQNEYREKPARDALPEHLKTKKLWQDVRAQFVGKQFGERSEKSKLLEHWSTVFDLQIPFDALSPEATAVVNTYIPDLEQAAVELTPEQIAAAKTAVTEAVAAFTQQHILDRTKFPPLPIVQAELSSGKLFRMFEKMDPRTRKLIASWVGILLVVASSLGAVLPTENVRAASSESTQEAKATNFTDFEQSSEEPPPYSVEVMAAFTTIYKEPQHGSGIANVPPQGALLPSTGEIDETGDWIKVTGVNEVEGWIPLANVKVHKNETTSEEALLGFNFEVKVDGTMVSILSEPLSGSIIVNIPPNGATLKTTGERVKDSTGAEWINVMGTNGSVGWILLKNIISTDKTSNLSPTAESDTSQAETTSEHDLVTVEVMAAMTTMYNEPQRGSGIANIPPQGAILESTGEVDASGDWIKVTGVNGIEGWIPLANVRVLPKISELPDGTSLKTARPLDIVDNIGDRGGVYAFEGERLTYTGISKGEWLQIIRNGGRVGWIKRADVITVDETQALNAQQIIRTTSLDTSSATSTLDQSRATVTRLTTPEQQQNVEAIFFNSVHEANEYLRDQELQLGYDRSTMSKEEMEALRREQRPNTDRTIRFVVGKGFWDAMIARGADPEAFLKKHIERLNFIYEKSGLPTRYTMHPAIILPQARDHTIVSSHFGDTSIISPDEEQLYYSFTDDTTWTLTDDCNDPDFPQYVDKILIELKDIGYDPGLVHEIVHHSGMKDLYWSHGFFSDMSFLKGIWPYAADNLGSDTNGIITEASALGMRKLLENKDSYGPNHNPEFFMQIELFGETIDMEAALADSYPITFINSQGQVLPAEAVKGFYLPSIEQEHTTRPDFSPDYLNYYKTVEGILIPIENNQITLSNELVLKTRVPVFKFDNFSLPLERWYFVYNYIYQSEKKQILPLEINFLVDINTFKGDGQMYIDMVRIPQNGGIPTTYNNRRVVAYSKIAETGVFNIWSMQETSP